MTTIKHIIEPRQLLKQWGHYAFARYCYHVGIPFEDAYFMIFGKEPHHA